MAAMIGPTTRKRASGEFDWEFEDRPQVPNTGYAGIYQQLVDAIGHLLDEAMRTKTPVTRDQLLPIAEQFMNAILEYHQHGQTLSRDATVDAQEPVRGAGPIVSD